MAIKEWTQSAQQYAASNRWDCANVSVIPASASGEDLMLAGLKSRLHTKHLAGKMVSRVMFKKGLTQSFAAYFRMRLTCTQRCPPHVGFKGCGLRVPGSEVRDTALKAGLIGSMGPV